MISVLSGPFTISTLPAINVKSRDAFINMSLKVRWMDGKSNRCERMGLKKRKQKGWKIVRRKTWPKDAGN
jgi:hypothetical protein